MSGRINSIELKQAKESYRDYEYALLYMLSGLWLGPTSELAGIDWEECLEARFFSSEKELHFFTCADGLHAVLSADDGSTAQTTKIYLLKRSYVPGKTKVVVREYLTYDEDGQLLIEKTRLAGLI